MNGPGQVGTEIEGIKDAIAVAVDLTVIRNSIPIRVTNRLGVYEGPVEDPTVVAWVRGRRPEGNAHHGSPLGAGLVRVVAPDGRELLPR